MRSRQSEFLTNALWSHYACGLECGGSINVRCKPHYGRLLFRAIVACSANGGSLTLVSATGAGGHCKGKRVIHSGRKKTEMCGAVLQAEAASSLRLRL